MNKPLDIRAEKMLARSVLSMRDEPAFSRFIGWINDELKKRDIENRSKTTANATTEAEALAYILEYVDACWSSRTDLNDEVELDEEGKSAALII